MTSEELVARCREMSRLVANNGQRSGGTVFMPARVVRELHRDDGSMPDLVKALDDEGVPDGALLMFKNGECTVATEEDFI